MRRGTTPTITINADLDLTDASNLFVTFKQDGVVVFEKTLSDVTVTEETVVVNLTQDETLALNTSAGLQFQIRASLGDNKVASNVMQTTVEKILKEGVI